MIDDLLTMSEIIQCVADIKNIVRPKEWRVRAADMESFKMFSCQTRNVPSWKRLIPAKLPNTLSGCPGIWLPMTGTMPIITPPSRSGWTRTARA